jgi:hypothetical protein
VLGAETAPRVNEIPGPAAETSPAHQHFGSSSRAKQPRSARPHSRTLHASTR